MRNLARAGIASASLLAFSLTACGSDNLSSGGASSAASEAGKKVEVAKDDALAKLVPADIAKTGTLTVGTDASYAPNEFTAEDGKTIQGMDVDLLTAVANKLGLKVEFQNGNFDTLIGGVTSGKYPVSISSFTINADRMKSVTMVQYFNAGTAWASAKGNPKKVDAENACGMTVGVQKGTTQVDDLTARSKKCTDAGKQAIKQVVEVEQSKVTADLIAGKVDAFAADSPVTAYAVGKNSDKIEKLGATYDSAPYGIVVKKDNTAFADAISKALEALQKDGSYKKILDQWSNADGAVTSFPVNPKA